MTVLMIIITIVSLAVSVTAIVIATKKQTVKEVVKTNEVVKIEHAPVEHPFTFDKENEVYVLNGNLCVKGSVSALDEYNTNKEN